MINIFVFLVSSLIYELPIDAALDAVEKVADNSGMRQVMKKTIEKETSKGFQRGQRVILKRGSLVSEVTFLEKIKSGRAKIINKHDFIDVVMLFELEGKDGTGNIAG